MDWVAWIKFAALMNIIVFLWYLRMGFKKSTNVERLHEAMRLKPGNRFLKLWWLSFLVCVSYRLGACATQSPEAIAYGMFPTLLLAMHLIDLADCKAREPVHKTPETGTAGSPGPSSAKSTVCAQTAQVPSDGPVLKS